MRPQSSYFSSSFILDSLARIRSILSRWFWASVRRLRTFFISVIILDCLFLRDDWAVAAVVVVTELLLFFVCCCALVLATVTFSLFFHVNVSDKLGSLNGLSCAVYPSWEANCAAHCCALRSSRSSSISPRSSNLACYRTFTTLLRTGLIILVPLSSSELLLLLLLSLSLTLSSEEDESEEEEESDD